MSIRDRERRSSHATTARPHLTLSTGKIWMRNALVEEPALVLDALGSMNREVPVRPMTLITSVVSPGCGRGSDSTAALNLAVNEAAKISFYRHHTEKDIEPKHSANAPLNFFCANVALGSHHRRDTSLSSMVPSRVRPQIHLEIDHASQTCVPQGRCQDAFN